ncbi:MAG: hypothetical protein GC134_01350 [Proteobacteria bacterium]|nr:hypothetical protein [Pseudomonadota bacterium]
MSFESPDFDCCERLRQAVMGLERAIANGARLSADDIASVTPITFGGVDADELARLKEENEDLKAKQAQATVRLDKLIDSLSAKMELDA